MKIGTLWKLSVTTSLQAEDAVTELLGRLSGGTVAVYANEETRISEVSVYLTKRTQWTAAKADALAKCLELIRTSGIEIGPGKVEIGRIKREDWSESWKRHFKPIEIGAKLLIKPSWIKQKPKKNQAVVVIDPGLSFGTGNHPTTSFCLHELANARLADTAQRFLDIGSGSGILSIAAVKLGYATVKAFDFDPEAVRVSKENASINKVADKLQPTRKDITKLNTAKVRPYDVVCANLISTLLMQEKARIKALVRPGGKLILAGILAKEFVEVRKCFEKTGFKFVRSLVEGEWESGTFMKL